MSEPRIVQFDENKLWELLERSHQAVAQVQSNTLGEIKTELALIKQSASMNHETLTRIETQTIKTNGRVTALEKVSAVNESEVSRLKKVVYGAVGLILVAFAGGLTSVVFIK